MLLLGQGDHAKVPAEPTKDTAAVCSNEIPLCLGGWDFCLGRGALEAAAALPAPPSALEWCCVMEMELRAVLTAGLLGGTCGYQGGGLDTPDSCWLFPKPGAAVQTLALQDCSPWLHHSQSHPPQCSFPLRCPLSALMGRVGGYSLGQGLQVQMFVATIRSSGIWLTTEPPTPSRQTQPEPRQCLTDPAS